MVVALPLSLQFCPWHIAYQSALLEYRNSGFVGAKLEVAVTTCINALRDMTEYKHAQQRQSVSGALMDMLVLRHLRYKSEAKHMLSDLLSR